jgi:hypothetical protein
VSDIRLMTFFVGQDRVVSVDKSKNNPHKDSKSPPFTVHPSWISVCELFHYYVSFQKKGTPPYPTGIIQQARAADTSLFLILSYHTSKPQNKRQRPDRVLYAL